jgi:carboxymethylenebutenolidase
MVGHVQQVEVEKVTAHLIMPARQPRAGVLLLPTIASVNPFILEAAASLAATGLTSLIWDPYMGEDVSGLDLRAQAAKSRSLTDDATLAEQHLLIDYMTKELRLEHVGVIGWCLGGRMVFTLGAAQERLEACVAYHPTIYSDLTDSRTSARVQRSDMKNQSEDEIARAAQIRCPVQLIRPGIDMTSDERYEALQAALLSRRAPTVLEAYPEAEHGFPYHLDVPANKYAYDLAWPSTLRFLETCLS